MIILSLASNLKPNGGRQVKEEKPLSEIRLAIAQGSKGEVVQELVRDDTYALRGDAVEYGSNQPLVQVLQRYWMRFLLIDPFVQICDG